MTRRLVLAALLVLAVIALPAASQASRLPATVVPAPVPTLRVETVGDSLTLGYGSSDGQGYRRELGRLLTDAGVPAAFTIRANAPIGTMTVQDIRAGIDAWITEDQPQIILLDIGTNNASGQKTGMTGVEAAIHDLLSRIVADAPNADVYVATLQYSSASWSVNEPYINQFVIQASWEHPGHVFLAAMDPIPVCGWLFDNIHPENAGYAAMGRQWYRAIGTRMGLQAIPPDAFSPSPPRPGFDRAAVVAC